MKNKFSAVVMWIASIPITAKGIEVIVHGVTTFFGLVAAVCGGLMGIFGVVWWLRRLKRQRIKTELEELELQMKRNQVIRMESESEDP